MTKKEKLVCAACGQSAFNVMSEEQMQEEFHRLHPGVYCHL